MKKLYPDNLYVVITLLIAIIGSIIIFCLIENWLILLPFLFFAFFTASSVYIFHFQKNNIKLLLCFLFSFIPAISGVFFVKEYSVSTVMLVAYSLTLFSFVAVQCCYQIIRDLKENGFKIKKISLGDPQKKLTRREILNIVKKNLIVMLIIFILQIAATAFFGFLYAKFRWHQYVGELFSSWSIEISFFAYFLCCCFAELPFGMLSVLIISYKTLVKRLCEGCIIFLFICFGFVCFVFLAFRGTEYLCFWNPLIDTCHSSTFNINNVPKIKEGMTRAEVDALIGEPIEQNGNYNRYTHDGACLPWGDFAWFKFGILFEDDIVIKIDSDIICD